jgi:hypothetical protein
MSKFPWKTTLAVSAAKRARVEVAQARKLDVEGGRRRTDFHAGHELQAGRRLDCRPLALGGDSPSMR